MCIIDLGKLNLILRDLNLGSSHFLILPPAALKIQITSKVVKSDLKIIISRSFTEFRSKSLMHMTFEGAYDGG